MPGVAVLVVAAGKGERAGGAVPKQYAPLLGKPMLRWSLEAFAGHRRCDPGRDRRERPGALRRRDRRADPRAGPGRRPDAPAFGDARPGSSGASQPDYVLIHDAARPLVSPGSIDAVLDALRSGADAAVPLLPVADTLRSKEDGKWVTVPRDGLLRAQTPQGFRFAKILDAHRRFMPVKT